MKDITAIVYTSNTGFTMRYALLLSQAAAIPAYDLENPGSAPPPRAKVLYLGWLSAGRIKGLAKACRRWDVQAVCAVGMAPNNDPVATAQANRVSCPLFCLQGGYAPRQLTGVPKLMMWMFTRVMTRKPPENEEQAGMQQLLRTGCDCVSEANLAPVLAWLREQDAP